MFAFLLLAGAVASASPAAPTVRIGPSSTATQCPQETPRTRGLVTRLLTSDALAAFRADYGLQGVRADHLQSVTDPAACNAIAHVVSLSSNPYPHAASYYHAGGFYFVPVVTVLPPGHLFIGHDGVIVLDDRFGYVASFAM